LSGSRAKGVRRPTGRYRATVRLDVPSAWAETIDLVVDAKTYCLALARGAMDASVMVTRDERAVPFSMQIAVTPPQPFLRGTALPIDVSEIEQTPSQGMTAFD
jgi:hypothetical protein